MEITERTELKERLKQHYGSIGEVCKRANISREYLRMIFNGTRNSDSVLVVAMEVLEEYERKQKGIDNKKEELKLQLGFQAVA